MTKPIVKDVEQNIQACGEDQVTEYDCAKHYKYKKGNSNVKAKILLDKTDITMQDDKKY
ncbi:hypothetical protein [Paenibacillus sp. sgz302251]|uniref:hypothetical protein n=1 Tax=Paenibacillus sp. sgz302251 TaxID=3414493 RepID=UPI003C7C54F9